MSAYENRKIGKKVWVLEEAAPNNWNFVLNKEITYEIVGVKEPKEVDDWCYHYLLKDDKGNEREVREYQVLVKPDETLEETHMLDKYISDNEVYHDGVWHETENIVAVQCEWGDWKHTHGWLRTMMGYIGYKEVYEDVTEENGSDCYSATHGFVKTI